MVYGNRQTSLVPFRQAPIGLWPMMLEGDSGAPPSGTSQTTTPPPATEGTGTTPGGQGGAGTPPAGGTPPQPQATGTLAAAPAATPPATPPIQWTQEQQTAINQIVQARLASEKDTEKKTADTAQAAKDQQKKIEQGLFKDVADEREKTITQLQEQLMTERRARIASKHNLPSDVATRLVGTTEEELDADARKLAALLKPQPAPKTEAGAGNRPPGSATPQQAAGAQANSGGQQGTQRYAFQQPGDVSWN